MRVVWNFVQTLNLASLTDPDMFLMVKSGIRGGGVATISHKKQIIIILEMITIKLS